MVPIVPVSYLRLKKWRLVVFSGLKINQLAVNFNCASREEVPVSVLSFLRARMIKLRCMGDAALSRKRARENRHARFDDL